LLARLRTRGADVQPGELKTDLRAQ
jgi:hypothetical protein